MTTGDTAYRLLLRALPADLRRDFGDDMVQLFRDQREAIRGRALSIIRLWLAAIVDVLREAMASRAPAPRADALSWGQVMRASALDRTSNRRSKDRRLHGAAGLQTRGAIDIAVTLFIIYE